MPRPPKKGLAYFPKDIDYYQDEKIVELAIKYGLLGLTTFDVLLTLIYREGYYIEMSPAKAALFVVRTVGGNWYRKSGMSAIDFATEIIQYCAEIGLLDETLVRQDVMTSIGIQKRYAAVTARNKVDRSKYWLLDKDRGQTACESMPSPGINAAETRVSVTETPINDAKMQQRKEKKIKVNYISDDKRQNQTPTDDRASRVISEFERLLPKLPKPVMSSRLLCNVLGGDKDEEYFSRVFERASRSGFLSAAAWCTIEWLTTPENMDKVLSGRYDDFVKKVETPAQKPHASSGFDTSEIMQAIYERSTNRGCELEDNDK